MSERSGLHALRELRAIEEQRVREEAELRAREAARADDERARRDQIALEAARLRGELSAALARVAELEIAPPPPIVPPPPTPWAWMLGCATTAALAVAFGIALIARPPEIHERVVTRVQTVPSLCKLPSAPPPAPEPLPPAVAPTRPHARPAVHPAAPTAPTAIRDCGDDVLCNMDDKLDDMRARPHR